VDYHFQEWNLIREDPDITRSVRLWKTFEAHKKAHVELVAKRKLEMYSDFCKHMDLMTPPEQARTISAMKRNKARAKGSPLKTDPTSMAENGLHFAKQFQNNLEEVSLPEIAFVESKPIDFEAILHPEAIKLAIRKLAKGKATGNSGLPAEVLIALVSIVWQPLQYLFIFCAENQVVPTSWTKARIHPVPKKGDLTKISNYRPISLTEVGRKLFESMLLPVVTGMVEPLSVEQGGFRSHRGTMDQVAALQEWISQSLALKRERFMAFLDIKAAYDQVDRRILWYRMKQRGVPENMVGVLKALFDSNESFVAINGHLSPSFPISSGVLQGSLISPLLYSIFIDDLIRDLNDTDTRCGTRIGGRAYRCLLYADDIVLMANSRSSLKSMLQEAETHSHVNRYRFSVAKCELVASSDPHRDGPLMLYDQPLPVSQQFTYLGVAFKADGIDWPSHQKRMATRALAAAGSLRDSGINGRIMSMSTSLSAFRTFVRPILEYGLSICPRSKLDTIRKTYRRCLSWACSAGKGACIASTELFGGLEPFDARHEKLGRRFYMRTLGLQKESSFHFAIVDAFKSANEKSTISSVFKHLRALESVKAINAAQNRRFWRAQEEPLVPQWASRLEDFILDACSSFKSAFIFGGRDAIERKAFLQSYKKLKPTEQRWIYLWCLNRASGLWKLCRHCHTADGTKSHLEACALGLCTVPTGPSNLEDRLFNTTSVEEMKSIAEDIHRCIGDGPID
jgi:hypothetical protein